MVDLPGSVLDAYPRFSRFNSPYPEHDAATAIDLYPDRPDDRAQSPVAGEVIETRTVRCPSKPYAVAHDHLIVVDTGEHLARILHVDPAPETASDTPTIVVGDRVTVGDPLGQLVRSGFFAPWVANHLHVAFRPHDANPVRATGSLPLALPDTTIAPVHWDGTGTVIDTGDTWAVLDRPTHPAPGESFAGIASDGGHVLDGGVPHYDHGGIHADAGAEPGAEVSLLGTTVGDVADGTEAGDSSYASEHAVDCRSVDWRDVTVTVNDDPIVGLSLFCGRDWLGAKLVHRDHDWAVGDHIEVGIEPPEP